MAKQNERTNGNDLREEDPSTPGGIILILFCFAMLLLLVTTCIAIHFRSQTQYAGKQRQEAFNQAQAIDIARVEAEAKARKTEVSLKSATFEMEGLRRSVAQYQDLLLKAQRENEELRKLMSASHINRMTEERSRGADIDGSHVDGAKLDGNNEKHGKFEIDWTAISQQCRQFQDIETGSQNGIDYILVNLKLCVIRGTNSVAILFSCDREGIATLESLIRSSVFQRDEQALLHRLLEGKFLKEESAGRLSARVASLDASGSTGMPKAWICIDLWSPKMSFDSVSPARLSLGLKMQTGDLLRDLRYGEMNKLLFEIGQSTTESNKFEVELRAINALAIGCGATGAYCAQIAKASLQDCRRRGLADAFVMVSVKDKLSFLVARDLIELQGWSKNRAAPPND